MNRLTIATGLAMCLAWPAVTAQAPVADKPDDAVLTVPGMGLPAPTLTETQRLQFQVLFQQREIAQLKFEAATADIARLTIAVNVVPGYTFDLATLSYRPEPKKESSP